MGFTCSARGPLGPRPSTKETFCPSWRSSYCTPSRFEEWKKMSLPPGRAMNPNPLSVSFLIVPSGIAMSVRSRASGRDVAWVTAQAAHRTRLGEYSGMSSLPQQALHRLIHSCKQDSVRPPNDLRRGLRPLSPFAGLSVLAVEASAVKGIGFTSSAIDADACAKRLGVGKTSGRHRRVDPAIADHLEPPSAPPSWRPSACRSEGHGPIGRPRPKAAGGIAGRASRPRTGLKGIPGHVH